MKSTALLGACVPLNFFCFFKNAVTSVLYRGTPSCKRVLSWSRFIEPRGAEVRSRRE